ncbi:hypothetical protein GOODEAATRI_024661 [Goodea atripinnis]|uniref:Interleukin-1 beta n=1 Tax=Goodea atripinnis TaxID=208336 RepID=A0ABV0P7H1_9TELE
MAERTPTFQRISSVKQFTLCDIYQKNLIRNPRDFKLQAITLRGGYCERKGNERPQELFAQEISKDQNMDRFLFIKSPSALSLTTFESVKYRGWFISTSSKDSDQTVEMCQAAVPGRVTSFKDL